MVGYIIYPVSSLFLDSVRSPEGQFSLQRYLDFFNFQEYNYIVPFINSIQSAFFVMLGTSALGLFFGYLFTRYDFPGKSLLYSLLIVPLIMPGFIAANAYILLYGRAGVITQLIQQTFNLSDVPFSIGGFWGLVIVQTVTFFPLAFLTITASLSRLDYSLNEAAESLGSSRFTVFRKVTLPLLTPGIIASNILVFMMSIADFGTPLFMEFNTLTVSIWRRKIMGQDQMSATLSVILTLTSIAFLFLARWYQSRKEYVSLSKGEPRAREFKSDVSKYLVAGITFILLFLIFLPFGMIILMSFTQMQHWGFQDIIPTVYNLNNFREIFTTDLVLIIRNSLTYAAAASVLAVVYGVFTSYFLKRNTFKGIGIIDAIVTSPYAIPGTVLGVSFIIAFNRGTIFSFNQVLVNTPYIIILIYFIRRSPYTIRSVNAIFDQIGESVEEASYSLGAGWFYTFRRVILPLIKPGLIAGLMLTFITAIAEFNATILLYTPDTMTIPISIYRLIYDFKMGTASAMALIQISLAMAAILLINKLVGLKALKL